MIILWGFLITGILVYFMYEYYRNNLIRPINYSVAIYLFLPMILMFPFSFSINNALTIGVSNYLSYLPFINKALTISLIGSIFYIASMFIIVKSKKFISISFLTKGVQKIITQKSIRILILILVTMFLLLLTLNGGEISKGIRNSAMSGGLIRILYNSYTSYYLVVVFSFLMYLRNNNMSKFKKFSFIFLILTMGILTGSRSIVVMPLLFFYLGILSVKQNYHNNKIQKKILFIFILIIVSMLMYSYVRSTNNGNSSNASIINNFFYGNTFSDFRDTAWILSGFDGEFAYGKTYFAAMVSFIPSSLLEFRSVWSLGEFTNRLAGIESVSHPGLRPIIFGESYFNFGYIGVIWNSIIFGIITGLIDNYHKYYSKNNNVLLSGFSFILLNLTHYLMITSGFFSFYIQILCISFCYITIKNKG